ncbi:hypothetical protein K443DRAFT_670792 [Laccaria amethystina LaAM-08-1]|jgi:hypothetical protein|uniref:F-box domain-containing protein n=1 Tax=Laccaria amethystina LaAM-08-1 TaxID=1095629 RepID=A0A0C9XD30_9AGAR|nr:hypothetical protein K443DRAFT_670792 [Laccaria amethystina LaAM-08-1]
MNRDEILISIEEALAALESKRTHLLQEVNAVERELAEQKSRHASIVNENTPIYKLPNELLVIILTTSHQLTSRARYPFTVLASHVSSRWRQVVLATPFLWNDIDLDVRPLGHTRGRTLQRLSAHLTRSDPCHLDISLSFGLTEEVAPYLELISAHSKRWRRLSIVARSERVNDINMFLRPATTPALEHLSLHIGTPQDGLLSPRVAYRHVCPQIMLAGAPSLSFVRLAGLALGNMHPPSNVISTLHLDGWTRHYMTHDQFKTIFEGLPSLVNLSMNQLCIHHPRDPLAITAPIRLPLLRSLRIRGPCAPPHRLLGLLRLPALESLSLLNMETFDSDTIPTLQILSLDSCAFGETEILNLFAAFPAVVYLGFDESVQDIYEMLCPMSDDLDTLIPWPSLQSLAVRALQTIDVDPLCAMISKRAESGKPLATLSLDRRSRHVLKSNAKHQHRMKWLEEKLRVDKAVSEEVWPAGLEYDDPHDFLE